MNGIIRRLDNLGRITLPKEMRDNLGWNIKDVIEIKQDGKEIILRKAANNGCIIYGGNEYLKTINGADICYNCVQKIKRM